MFRHCSLGQCHLTLTLDVLPDWIPKCLSYSRGASLCPGSGTLHQQWPESSPGGEGFVFLQRCFWTMATGSPFTHLVGRAHEKGSLIHVFLCLLINWECLFFPLTQRFRISGLERGSPAVSFKWQNTKSVTTGSASLHFSIKNIYNCLFQSDISPASIFTLFLIWGGLCPTLFCFVLPALAVSFVSW